MLPLSRVDGYCMQGQNQDIWGSTTFEPGNAINLFTQWNGVPLDEGFLVSLPSEWRLISAQAVSQAYRYVQLNSLNLSDGHYLLSSSNPLWGAYDLILQIQTDKNSTFQNYNVSVAPAIKVGSNYTPDNGSIRHGELHARSANGYGTVLAFDKNTAPLHIQPRWIEAFTHSYTIEFWIQTTALNAIVLSSWDGSEENLYPIEFIIDAKGQMRYYRNTVNHHITLSTGSVVSDGSWHHISLVYDPEIHWTKLYLNGQIADSLLDPRRTYLHATPPVALGGRLDSDSSRFINRFTGKLDDLRLWPTARTVTQINGMMRQSLAPSEVLALNFESAESFKYFEESNIRDYLSPGGPMFDPLVDEFRGVILDEGVMLTWKNKDPRSTAFRIERSGDGIHFENLARIDYSLDRTQWSYIDPDPSSHIVFYRLIQELPEQQPQISGIIKLGLGPETTPSSVEILGNYPNPFNPQTLITYEVRESQHVRLSIINISGLVVAELADNFHEAGIFEVNWDGTELSSGTYFARIQGQDGTVLTRQILLTK
ncbi:MAG: T9SS type A sorting domain-containing protein [Bacteroidetes bacterium]|nr:T9SS type A sorting domain-containing protein [Bacteroidota bacterium]